LRFCCFGSIAGNKCHQDAAIPQRHSVNKIRDGLTLQLRIFQMGPDCVLDEAFDLWRRNAPNRADFAFIVHAEGLN
jgi:hypothetical protein